jgi:hypothetical protein
VVTINVGHWLNFYVVGQIDENAPLSDGFSTYLYRDTESAWIMPRMCLLHLRLAVSLKILSYKLGHNERCSIGCMGQTRNFDRPTPSTRVERNRQVKGSMLITNPLYLKMTLM